MFNVALCDMHFLIHQVEALSVQDIKSSLRKQSQKKIVF